MCERVSVGERVSMLECECGRESVWERVEESE